MKLIEPPTHVQRMQVERVPTENLTRRASKREKYMALIFILKCDHFPGMETKQTLVKERTEHVPYSAIISLDLIQLRSQGPLLLMGRVGDDPDNEVEPHSRLRDVKKKRF